METLKNYINENKQVSLSEYIMIDEGLLRWIKRKLRDLFRSVEKNKRDHGGYYAPYTFMKDVVNNDDATINQGGNSNSKYKGYDNVKIEKSKLMELIQNLKTENNTNPFFDALDYCKNKSNEKTIFFLSQFKKTDILSDYLCIIAGEKKDNQFIIDEVFWNDCVRKQYHINKQFAKNYAKLVINDISGIFQKEDKIDIEDKDIGPIEKFAIDDDED